MQESASELTPLLELQIPGCSGRKTFVPLFLHSFKGQFIKSSSSHIFETGCVCSDPCKPVLPCSCAPDRQYGLVVGDLSQVICTLIGKNHKTAFPCNTEKWKLSDPVARHLDCSGIKNNSAFPVALF